MTGRYCCGSSDGRRCPRACALRAAARNPMRSPRGVCPAAAISFQADLAGVRPINAGDEPKEFGPSRANQPGDAQHLAAPKHEAGILDRRTAAQARDFEHDFPGGEAFVRRGRQLAPDHPRDHRALGRFLHYDVGHLASVAQDGRRVADPEYLIHFVRDVDDRDALRCEFRNQQPQAVRTRPVSGSRSARPWREPWRPPSWRAQSR